MLNMVVDAAAKHSATAVGMDETVGQSLAVAWRQPANPDPYYFSIGSMAVLGETRAAAALAVGDRLMAAVARRANTHCGFMDKIRFNEIRLPTVNHTGDGFTVREVQASVLCTRGFPHVCGQQRERRRPDRVR